jgi:serine/threonine-protein kinase
LKNPISTPEALEQAMSEPGGLRGDVQRRHVADRASDGGRGAASQHLRCRLAAGTGPGLTGEMSAVLRTRLRLAVLVLLGGFALLFLRGTLLHGLAFGQRPPRAILGDCEIAVLAIASALLWGRRPLSLGGLRAIEWAVFGALAAYFGWLQVDTYHDGALLNALAPGHRAMVFRLVGTSAAFGWSLLIVLYGAFIPNTGRRCARVVVGLAVLPVALLVADSVLDRATGASVLSALPEMIILMATAAAIAVFGSHKIRELHRKAHEAERVGQYRLQRVLGFGGMGTVYLAEHVLLRRPCAVKLISPHQAGDPRALRRFEREVRAAAALTHWNTVEVYDYGHTEDGTFYYAMEYLPGLDLQEMVERHGPLPPGRAVHLLRQVCEALREAHGVGLVHRDVKPSNIIACQRGGVYDVAKLLDFGLVKTFGAGTDAARLTGDGAFTGSPAFMSPEQALGREQLDARSDIYNVGAVAYFLLTGVLAFDRQSALEMLHAHAYEPLAPGPEFQEAVPADLQGVILRCLEKDPNRRYQDAATLGRALAACTCAGEWTAERAAEWWRHNGDGPAVPPALEAGKRATQTVSVGP